MLNTRQNWWTNATVFQVLIQTFQDSNNDGIGDFGGLNQRLPYIRKLGDAMWVTPFYQSPKRDNGYDVSDHTKIDVDYGTLSSARRTISNAQAQGIKVVGDQVIPHTSDQHQWFQQSRQSRTNPKADWYVWADPAKDGGPPNNWLSVFGGPAWTFEPQRGQYYLHHFYPHQPKVNLDNPKVADAQLRVTEFLLGELRLDGLRLDAYDYLFHNRNLTSNPDMPPELRISSKPFGVQNHIHDMTQAGETLAFTQRLRLLVGPEIFLMGEFSSQPGANQRIANLNGPDRLDAGYSLGDLARKQITHSAIVNAHKTLNGSTAWCFANHDTEGVVSRHSTDRNVGLGVARQLAVVPAVLGGLSFVYQREELGLTDAKLHRDQCRDQAGRDPSRTPVPWTNAWPNGGFTDSKAVPYLPMPPEHLLHAVSRQETDPSSHLNFSRAVQAMRHTDAFRYGDREILPTAAPVLAVVIHYEGQKLPFVFNLSNEVTRVPFAAIPRSLALSEPALAVFTNRTGITLPPRALIMPDDLVPTSAQPPRMTIPAVRSRHRQYAV